ncbi:hypothetical protein LIER_21633 [Lithospermum erythrorhizon]|uniref:Reverse transcriptase RNase H-like domain-containing protein n=1 Tax=Lithospermum erythrorhizon TaxID=34254 RepID=A0AAV3QU14_LITER
MNLLKCAFGVTSEKFLGFVVRMHGIEIEHEKIDAIVVMPEPRNLLRLKVYKGTFHDVKTYLMSPPMLVVPIQGKPLILYIATREQSVGALLAQENEEGKDNALYYLSRRMIPNEQKYTPIEKLCLTLIFAIHKLKHYFQAHTVRLISKASPIKYVVLKPVLSNRLARWYLQLQQFMITYVPQKAVKGQVMADLLVDHPLPAEWELSDELLDEDVMNVEMMPPWKMYFDDFLPYSFSLSGNLWRHTTYDQPAAGRLRSQEARTDPYHGCAKRLLQLLIDYLQHGRLPTDLQKRLDIRRNAPRFQYHNDTLFRRSFGELLLRCLSDIEAA